MARPRSDKKAAYRECGDKRASEFGAESVSEAKISRATEDTTPQPDAPEMIGPNNPDAATGEIVWRRASGRRDQRPLRTQNYFP